MVSILTTKQYNILQCVQKYIAKNRYSPSLGDLQQMSGIKTKRGVVHYLEALEKKGYIQRSGNNRGITIVKENIETSKFYNIPILGYANCGQPLALINETQIGTLKLDKNILNNDANAFAVIAKGDSMNKRSVSGNIINSNNYVIVSKSQEIQNGDVVLAIIDDGATIKTFRKDNEIIILYPESTNDRHQPIFLKSDNDGLIVGKVVAVLQNPTSE